MQETKAAWSDWMQTDGRGDEVHNWLRENKQAPKKADHLHVCVGAGSAVSLIYDKQHNLFWIRITTLEVIQ